MRITGLSTPGRRCCFIRDGGERELAGGDPRPLARSSGITRFQLEPSAHAA